MTVYELAQKHNFDILVNANAKGKEIYDAYCGDLLSWVMANAQKNNIWLTVMGNVNAIAVALLTECACILLTENAELDEAAKIRAQTQEVTILRTPLNTYNASIAIAEDVK